jgi:hypothetical protein
MTYGQSFSVSRPFVSSRQAFFMASLFSWLLLIAALVDCSLRLDEIHPGFESTYFHFFMIGICLDLAEIHPGGESTYLGFYVSLHFFLIGPHFSLFGSHPYETALDIQYGG